jgi:hypothetical protein
MDCDVTGVHKLKREKEQPWNGKEDQRKKEMVVRGGAKGLKFSGDLGDVNHAEVEICAEIKRDCQITKASAATASERGPKE